MNHPQWAIKYVHKSKVNAVRIVNWEDHHEIATVQDVYQFNGKESEGSKAARLIVAAPELLEALELAINLGLDGYSPTFGEHARAAIAKAKG